MRSYPETFQKVQTHTNTMATSIASKKPRTIETLSGIRACVSQTPTRTRQDDQPKSCHSATRRPQPDSAQGDNLATRSSMQAWSAAILRR